MGDTLSFYLWKTLLPIKLGPDYGRTPVWLMTHGWAYAMIVIPMAVMGVALAFRKRGPLTPNNGGTDGPLAPNNRGTGLIGRSHPWVAAALVIWLLPILPVSGMTPFDFQFYSTVADRYVYFAMLGIALAGAGVVASMPARTSIGVGVVVIGAFAVLSFQQLPVWANTRSLFTQGLLVNPRSAVSHLSIGHEIESGGDLDAAIDEYRKAVLYSPLSEQAHNNLGEALGKKWSTGSQPDVKSPILAEAKSELERAVQLRDNFPDGHANLGNVYYSLHRYADALAQFQAALRFNPDNPQYAYMAGMMYQQLGNIDQSRAYLQKAADHGFEPAERALKGQ